jgi:Mn2+/Fe2+ NRAMP family transporter
MSGTAAAVGAQTGYQLSWVALLVAPLLGVVLTIAAQVGAVARDDLQSLTRKRYGRGVAAVLLVSVVVVNLITIAADLQAGAAGIGLLAGVGSRWLVMPLGAALAGLLLAGRYGQVVAVLRYLMLGFAAFGPRPCWRIRTGPACSKPAWFQRCRSAATRWQAAWPCSAPRGVEEPPDGTPEGSGLARARASAVAGAVFTAVILWFMLVASAATLGRHHQAVTSAQDAAGALRPLAGSAAADLFAAGLVTSAVVALPVLMATTAYVVGAQFGWRRGLSEGIGRARAFYPVVVASVGLALAVSLANISVIGMLVAASVIGGFGTPVGLVLLARLARDPRVMGPRPISRRLAIAGWAVAVIVGGFGLLAIIGAALGTF